MEQSYQIIGGGIGGLCTALACQQQGLAYTLWEKQPQISYRRVGLGISRNIFPLLNDWGLLEETKALGAEVRSLSFVNKKFKSLRTLTLKAPALSVDRQAFTSLLLNSLHQDHIRLNSPRSPDEFSPGQTLIIAEGIHSPSRQRIYPQLMPRSSHQLLWRGMVEMPLPLSHHHTYYDFIGGNLRFAIIHSGGDLYSWYAIEVSTTMPPAGPMAATDARQHLLNIFQEYHPLVHSCIENSPHIYHDMLQDIDPKQRKGLSWYSHNAVFIGDAIHATTPNMANGACLAMEDAWVLVKLLKRYEHDRQKAFRTYQALREEKINTIVRQSWLLGKMMHQANPLLDRLNLLGTRLMPQWAFEKIYGQVLNNESIQKAGALAAASQKA